MMKTFIKIILFLLFSNCALAYCDFEIVKIKSGIHSLASKINLIHNIENQRPFVYFPLQTDPERSTLIAAPRFSNQIEVITNIAKSLPDGYDLYVKEHPMMILREWRSISDYKQIMGLPNVILIHPSVKSDYIIKKSSLVVSINSTSGLESGFYNKPSISFSDQDFSYLSFVQQIKSFQELPDAIKKSLKKKVNISDLNNYVNLIESNSFETDLFGTSAYFDNLFHYGEKLNEDNHYLISNIFNDIRKGHSWYDPWPAYIHWGPKGLWETIISNKYYFNVSRCNKHYERILQDYIDNTNLQRCHGRCR